MRTWSHSASRSLTQLWGYIRAGVENRATTRELWESIRGSGIPATIQQVNDLRSAAAQIRNARENFAAAADEYTITHEMISTAPWARSEQQQRLAPSYQLNIPYVYTNEEGEQVSDWYNKTVSSLPATVGELYAMADTIIDQNTTPPTGATVSGPIEIMRV